MHFYIKRLQIITLKILDDYFSFQGTEKVDCLMHRKAKLSNLVKSLIFKHEFLLIIFKQEYLLSFFLPETF